MTAPRYMKPASLVLLMWTTAFAVAGGDAPAPTPLPKARPIVAVWRDNDGFVSSPPAPYLRVAVWEDGTVLFGKDPGKWGHELQTGRIAAYRVTRLKAALADSGVFSLKGHCYLGPDLPVDCIMVDAGGKQQTLYWVEGVTNWMTTPGRKEFVRAWTTVNHLALLACPDDAKSAEERFDGPPGSWYVKDRIQSE
jgi:hypothetical protein